MSLIVHPSTWFKILSKTMFASPEIAMIGRSLGAIGLFIVMAS